VDADEYRAFENKCLEELEAKQEGIAEILLFDREIDFDQCTIRYGHDGELLLEAGIIPIGSWGQQSKTWMWAWANPSMDPVSRAESGSLQQLHGTTGNAEFLSQRAISATERRAWGLTLVACRHFGAVGAYKETVDGTHWFFVIRELKHLKAPEVLLEIAQFLINEALATGRWARSGHEDFGQYLRLRDRRGLQSRTISTEARMINMLRKRFPEVRLDLTEADLRREALPWAHDLHAQILFDYGVPMHEARDLVGANLSGSRFDGAIMRGLTLCDVSFDHSSLVDADLSGADLNGASFRNTFLNGVNFTRSSLAGADFAGAELSRTLLTDVYISEVKGLDKVHHMMASEVSFSTLLASPFKTAPTFLRKAGVSRGLLQDLIKGKRFPGSYQTCFLSYSSKDAEFAERLYRSLTKAGVRVFWDHFDVLPGEYLKDQIAEAIREHDRLLVVLSANSMSSEWVRREIGLAWKRKRESLLPIRLCAIEDVKQWTEANEEMPDLANMFPIQDFSEWKVRSKYDHALSILLKSFSGGVDLHRPLKAKGTRGQSR
jgi:uncharacterized protein YjbI with pentapeptide repeats